jgi:hypothetical protein
MKKTHSGSLSNNIGFFYLMLQRLKRGSIHKKFSMTGQQKGDLLIQVTA